MNLNKDNLLQENEKIQKELKYYEEEYEKNKEEKLKINKEDLETLKNNENELSQLKKVNFDLSKKNEILNQNVDKTNSKNSDLENKLTQEKLKFMEKSRDFTLLG